MRERTVSGMIKSNWIGGALLALALLMAPTLSAQLRPSQIRGAQAWFGNERVTYAASTVTVPLFVRNADDVHGLQITVDYDGRYPLPVNRARLVE